MKKYAGTLLICKDTGNFLLLKRSKRATYPQTWSIVSGGVEKGESTLDAAKRELWEETQISAEDIEFNFFENQTDITPFYFYIGYCEEEYECILDDENIDWGWFNMNNLPEPLFPSLYSVLYIRCHSYSLEIKCTRI